MIHNLPSGNTERDRERERVGVGVEGKGEREGGGSYIFFHIYQRPFVNQPELLLSWQYAFILSFSFSSRPFVTSAPIISPPICITMAEYMFIYI